MSIIDYAQGYLMKVPNKYSGTLGHEHHFAAISYFEKALDGLPNNPLFLRNLASSILSKYARLHVILPSPVVIPDGEKEWINYLFGIALENGSKETHTLYQFANFHILLHNFCMAEEYLVRCVESDPESVPCISFYLNLLKHCGMHEDVEFLYSLKTKCGFKLLENYGPHHSQQLSGSTSNK